MLEPGDKIFLMTFYEALEYAEKNNLFEDRITLGTIVGIGRRAYDDIVSRNPHTISSSNDREFTLKSEPFIYEYWMVKRKSNIYLDNNLFELE